VSLRIGIVLATQGGALAKMLPNDEEGLRKAG
jgi:NAD dependent epimerase/dehydratase family enzyme